MMEIYSRKTDAADNHGFSRNAAPRGWTQPLWQWNKQKTKYKQISERIMNMEKKILDIDEPRWAHGDQNQGKAVITGFHTETSESEVIQLLKETMTEIGMSIENARIECSAEPITHAFIHFKNDDERNKYIRAANNVEKRITRKEMKDNSINGRRRKIPSEKNGVLQILHPRETQHCSQILVSMNWTLKHVSVKGQFVVKTCQSGSLKYIKYQDTGKSKKRQRHKRRRRQGQAQKSWRWLSNYNVDGETEGKKQRRQQQQ